MTPNICVSPPDSFWGLAAKQLSVDFVINCSRPKMSFDSVCQILVGEQQRYDFEKDFFIIGLPPLERITIFDDYKDTPLVSTIFDQNWKAHKENISSHHGLVNLQYQELDKLSITISDRAWVETQVLRQIFLITQWLDHCSANYLIVNLSKNLDLNNKWGPTNYILDYCINHKNCCLFENSLYNVNLDRNSPADFAQYGWYGHHDSTGNRHFFETTVKNKLC